MFDFMLLGKLMFASVGVDVELGVELGPGCG